MKPTLKFNGQRSSGRRRRHTLEERSRYLALFAESGQSVRDFCREHGLNGPTLYNWRRGPAAAGDGGPAKTGGFAEVAMAAAVDGALSLHLRDLIVEVRAGADAAWVARIVAELRRSG